MTVWVKTGARIVGAVRGYFLRHWQRALELRERVRFSEEAFHLLLAGGVGILGGLANLAFYASTKSLQMLTLRATGDLADIARSLNWWHRLIIPVLGGLASGMVLCWGLRLVGKQSTSNFLEAVVAGDGRLPFRTGIIKAISSLLSISTGASIGREGLITHLSATLASKWGQWARWQPYRLRLLVACGAAAGIAAAYNAPIAGAVFAAQIVLGNFSMSLFAPLVFASVIATVMSRTFFGIEQWYHVPNFDFTHLAQLPWFLVLGLLSGLVGAAFLKLLQQSETQFQRLPVSLCLRLAVGGLGVGIIATGYPEVWGNGYSITTEILQERFTLSFLVGLLLAKMLATLVTVGSGAVGGVFTPTLFIGAALGNLFGLVLHQVGYAEALPTGVFALVSMGSVLAATTHSPLLAMIMVFEISLNYSLMPALMLACAVATLVARQLHADSVYTQPLRCKAMLAERESQDMGAATERTVGELMRTAVPPVAVTATLREIADRFLTSSNNFLPVIDHNQRLLGIVALHDLKEYLHSAQDLDGVIAYDLMHPLPACLTPNQRLMDVLPVLLASDLRHIPVVNNPSDQRLVGAIVRAEALGVLSEAIAARSTAKT